jgi:hypothetical protein
LTALHVLPFWTRTEYVHFAKGAHHGSEDAINDDNEVREEKQGNQWCQASGQQGQTGRDVATCGQEEGQGDQGIEGREGGDTGNDAPAGDRVRKGPRPSRRQYCEGRRRAPAAKAGHPEHRGRDPGGAKEPMSCKAIVERAIAEKQWTTSGKTPHATLYAAIIREIDRKGGKARFKKVDRGRFIGTGKEA